MSKKLMVGMALVALVSMAMSPTTSASPVLTHPTETVQATGATVTGVNIGETLMTDTNMNVINRCSVADLSGELTKNSGSAMEGNVTSAAFTGTGMEGYCTGTFFSSFKVTPAVASGLPWCVRATSTMTSNEAQVRGGRCSEAAREIRFALDLSGGATCLYSRSPAEPIVGTFTTDTAQGQDAVVHISKQLFKPVSVPFPCPEETLLDMSFTLSVGGTAAYFS